MTDRKPLRPVDRVNYAGDPAHADIDTSTAHPARVYDWLLGGKDNFAADRAVAERLTIVVPDIQNLVRRNREFIHRAVRYLVGEQGIEQIIDVGTGIPTAPAVHEVARSINPNVRVAYVDNDPIVLAHDRALLSRQDGIVTFLGDLVEPESVLEQQAVRELIDFREPFAVLFAAVFHFITDDQDPERIVKAYREKMAPGSAVVISHLSTSHRDRDSVDEFVTNYQASAPLVFRPDGEIRRLFDGFHLVDPGLTPLHAWRPDDPTAPDEGGTWATAGVGLLRAPG